MPLPSVIPLTVIPLAKISLHIAEKKKWLPKKHYHRLSLDCLEKGDLKKAARYNGIALEKSSDFHEAQVVRDVIAMRCDAQVADLKKAIANEHRKIQILKRRLERIENSLRLKKVISKVKKLLAPLALILLSSALILLKSERITIPGNNYVWFIYGALASTILFLVFYLVRFRDVNRVRHFTILEELNLKIISISRELKIRQDKASQLEERLHLTYESARCQ